MSCVVGFHSDAAVGVAHHSSCRRPKSLECSSLVACRVWAQYFMHQGKQLVRGYLANPYIGYGELLAFVAAPLV